MEKKLYDLTIDRELRDLIPPLSEEERRMLEDSIVRDGCDTPLAVWNGTIVDGHNRYEICRAHGIPFGVEEKDFPDKDAVMFWMLERQLARRNLETYQRAEIMLKYAPILRKDAARRQATSTGGSDPQLVPNLAQAEKKGRSREGLAKLAGVSHGTLDKVKVLTEKADEETKRKLRAGQISIHKAYTELQNREHEGEKRVCECCGLEKPYSDYRIPSNRNGYRPVCKACEAKAKRAARDAETAASTQSAVTVAGAHAAAPASTQPIAASALPVEITGMAIRNGQLAHVPTQLRDDPALFDHVLSLLQVATNAYVATCETAISKLQPSMMTPENLDTIRQMIDDTADAVDDILTRVVTENGKEDM